MMIDNLPDEVKFQLVHEMPADVAVGEQISMTVPDNVRRLYLSISLQLTTAAGGSSRRPQPQGQTTGGLPFYMVDTSLGVGGSATMGFLYTMNLGRSLAPIGGNFVSALMPPDFWLEGGDLFVIDVVNFGASDRIQKLSLRYKEWVYPQ